MTRRQEPSEDYGYDLAHDVPRAGQELPAALPPPVRSAPLRRSGDRTEPPGGDLGYDEAHDF